jgi:hypothetical protein
MIREQLLRRLPMSDIKIGDSVVVKPGVTDPDLDIDIGGWQGRVLDIQAGGGDITLVHIQWDSLTLKGMPDSVIEQCEEQGLGWTEMFLDIREVEAAIPRDSEADVDRVADALSDRFPWSYLGEQGRRIRQVLMGVDTDDDMGMLNVWEEYLEENLSFPFEAEVDEYQERGPLQASDRLKVTGIGLVDDLYGIIVDLRRGRRKYAFPLCDLRVIDELSPNYQIVDDYRTWFANR